MIVEVKKEHIDEGVQGCPCYCAVSLAVYEALKDKYNFTDSEALAYDDDKEEVEVGESWVETAVHGYGAEISIYTKLKPKKFGQDVKIIEDYIEIKDLMHLEGSSALTLEDWIEDFDTFDDSKPTSFVIESINRMNN